ncbi:MAG: hypothetical protein MJ147_05055 [Clostridia bacterium]|nr:hypothetical protein [Clostridia bacterium]
MPYTVKPHLTRKITVLSKDDPSIPKELFEAKSIAPDLKGFPYPLPSKKSEYTCFAEGDKGIIWYGAETGLTRYDPNAETDEDKVMYFSATRHLGEPKVDAILPEGDNIWVLTGEYVSYIQMVMLTGQERAELLLEETNKYVKRRGMVSQRHMKVPRDFSTMYPYASSDNDGTFTAGHAAGEVFHYAVLKKELGEDHPKTKAALKDATESVEACLLLMYIHGRPEGFISRSYHVTGEPVPDDGFFYKRNGDYATCVETTASIRTGRNNEKVPCNYPIPERLRHLLTDYGYTEDDVTYKADTSSDEVSNHFMQMVVAHDILGEVDPELDEIIKDAARRTSLHIINGGYEFLEHSGKPTTWAKWSKRYFENDPTGYVDAPLNSAELLFYLKATMHITGEEGLWKEQYDKLIADGYADLATKHFDRFYQGAIREKCAPEEDLMYGDNMLATVTFWMLCTLEKDPVLLEKYRKGYKSWAHSLLREHNPGYEFPYIAAMPDEEVDVKSCIQWFNRFETSRYGAEINMYRHDTPIKDKRNEEAEMANEVSLRLPPDELPINKYDRNPYDIRPGVHSPSTLVEGCYVYTFAYWLGRYYGIIDEEG